MSEPVSGYNMETGQWAHVAGGGIGAEAAGGLHLCDVVAAHLVGPHEEQSAHEMVGAASGAAAGRRLTSARQHHWDYKQQCVSCYLLRHATLNRGGQRDDGASLTGCQGGKVSLPGDVHGLGILMAGKARKESCEGFGFRGWVCCSP